MFLCLAALVVSCSVEEMGSPETENNDVVFYATIDEQPDADTKVYADENLKVLWNEDDRITIFNKDTYNQQYRFLGEDGDNAGAIKIVGTAGSGDPLDQVYAVYPYAESTSINASGTISFTLPSEQSYHENSFGIGANTMVSVTDGSKLRFKNVGGYLSLKFYGEGVSVSSIELRSNNGEPISGPCTIVTSGGVPEVMMSDSASDQITMVCDPPVELGATSSEAVQFIFVLPPLTLSNGFTVTVTTPDGGVFEKSSTRERVIGRSAITPLGAMEVIPELPGNIVFADQTVKEICVRYWDTNSDGELSYAEAAAVKSLMVDVVRTRASDGQVSAFAGSGITVFDELVYFTGLTKIEAGTFVGCADLKSVTVPASVEIIGADAFSGCSTLQSITITSSIPPEIGSNAFAETNDCPIYVPEDALEDFVSEWPLYAERIVGAILPETFPDPEFRAYVFANFDTDNNGVLSEEECDAVTKISVYTNSIYSLEGIGLFRNLKSLGCSPKYTRWTANVDEWHIYNGDEEVIGKLTSLDLSNNVELTSLNCFGNQLTSINLKNCTSLTHLTCELNYMKHIDLCDSPELTVLMCSFNQLEELDLSQCINMNQLFCTGNELYSLDLSHNTRITYLDCSSNHLRSLDVSANPLLERINCGNCQLTSLNVNNNLALLSLSCGSNQLSTLDLYNNTNLQYLSCDWNQLSSLDLSANLKLASLVCSGNAFQTLDISKNTSLVQLYCYKNQLETLDVSNNLALTTLYCQENPMVFLYLLNGQVINALNKENSTEIVYLDNGLVADELLYISSTGGVIDPYSTGGDFGDAVILSNTYEEGKGLIKFDRPLTVVGASTFKNSTIQTVILPEGVVSIGDYAFQNCKLSTINLPSTLTSIGSFAFSNCSSLYSVTIPNRVVSIDDSAFSHCSNLRSFQGKFSSEDGLFLVVDGVLKAVATIGMTNVDFPSDVTRIGDYAFQYGNQLTSIVIPDGITSIGKGAFSNCSSLVSVSIPESVISIGDGAFTECRSLSAFNGKYASDDGRCLVVNGKTVGFAPSGLTDYTIPSNITEIAYKTFASCLLTSITVPSSVTIIGESAFQSYSLSSILFDADTPPILNGIEPQNTFGYCSIYVPAYAVDTYKEASSAWAFFAGRIVPRASLPEAVDLGLSVKWASFNLGAAVPEEKGGYYAWGEVTEKDSYSWATYKYGELSNKLSKYCTNESNGVVDGRTVLENGDDAAATHLGGPWRTPTDDDLQELLDRCEWEWTSVGESDGYQVTGPNGKSIFLPAAAHSDGVDGYGESSFGYYWASTINVEDKDRPFYLYFSESHGKGTYGTGARFLGASIRPVCDD